MGLWAALAEIGITAGRITGVCAILDAVRQGVRALGSLHRPVTFTVALIALSAKMAKADGIVSADELVMFRKLVEVPAEEERNVQRLFDIAQRDVAGFDAYARQIVELAEGDELFLADVLQGLFHIASADGYVHEKEMAFLEEVAAIFGLSERAFERVAAGFVRRSGSDPYRVLGLAPEASDEEVKVAWRRLASENHPDRHAARGLPAECMALLTDRLQQINSAYQAIRMERGLA